MGKSRNGGLFGNRNYINMNNVKTWLEANGALQLLDHAGVSVGDEALDKFERFLALIVEWNRVAGLVSIKDVDCLVERHLVDSISLAPVIVGLGKQGGRLLDIGSGGGFPAIPLGVLLPDLEILMVERTERKVGFLIKAARDLMVEKAHIIHGNFPQVAVGSLPDIVTARAIEKPKQLIRQLFPVLGPESVFLCQSREAEGLGAMFHVEPVQDEWQTRGLRRGDLYLVRWAKNDFGF
jgi:16S rRNA (guanine(527)-N(7))-methyltransferase RsmG